MKNLIVWGIHAPAGTIAILYALAAMFYQKGSSEHIKAGRYFTVSMLVMLFAGIVAAILKNSPNDIFLGLIVSYSVFTAWLTAHHKKNERNVLEYIALFWVILIAVAAYFSKPNIYPIWMFLAIFFAVGDIYNLRSTYFSDTQRIMRHVLRVGFSLLWAALAFTDKVIKLLGYSIEEIAYVAIIPSVFILFITLYWLIVVYVNQKSRVF